MGKKPRKKKAMTSSARASGHGRPAAVRPKGTEKPSTLKGLDTIPTVPSALARQRPTATAVPAVKRLPSNAPPTGSDPAAPVEAGPATPEGAATQAAAGGCAGIVAEGEPQALAATYWVDAPASAAPHSVAVRFTGSRIGVAGKPDARDRFDKVERVDGITAGSGRVAVTTRVRGINAGSWRVTATPTEETGGSSKTIRLPQRVETVTTRLAPLVHGPGVRLAAWPVLVGLGAVVAITLQALLLARADLDVTVAVVISLIACVVGSVGAKVWYLVLHRKHPRHFVIAGACIQGFLVGAIGTLAIGAAAFRLPVGILLDVTAPGVFFGMAIGRPGCFLTGCCAGRPTSSRWGLWSSDRRLGMRRFPVQLVEAVMALVIAVVSLLLVLAVQQPVPGAVFVGAIAAYTFGRQLLFPLRTDSHTSTGRMLTMVLTGLVLVADLAAFTIA